MRKYFIFFLINTLLSNYTILREKNVSDFNNAYAYNMNFGFLDGQNGIYNPMYAFFDTPREYRNGNKVQLYEGVLSGIVRKK